MSTHHDKIFAPCPEQGLSESERTRYAELNVIVKDGMSIAFKMGEALREIRDSRLYREDFTTWENYCCSVMEMSKTQADRLVKGAEVLEDLTPFGVKVPCNESQVRQLGRLKTAVLRKEAWNATIDLHSDDITAEKIKNVVDDMLGVGSPETGTDLFELADGTTAKLRSRKGGLISPSYLRGKLSAMEKNNCNAPEHCHVSAVAIAQRQSVLLKFVAQINSVGGEDADEETKAAIYWAMGEAYHLVASIRPVTLS